MKSLLRLRVWLLALVLLATLGQPVLAQDGTGAGVLFGQDYRLPSGQRPYGDVVVFGGSAFIEDGGVLHGDLMTVGGAIDIAGEVDGDVFALGGDVRLRETAVVSGDVTASGDVVRDPGARVTGQVMNSFRTGVRVPTIRPWVGPSICLPTWGTARPWGTDLGNLLAETLRAVFGALAVVALGVLVVLVIPGPTRVVGESLVEYPAQSIGVGLLTGLVAILAVPLLVITCLGIPVAVALALALGIAVLFGWIAGGLVLGERALRALNQAHQPPLAAVALGLVILALLSAVPCLGFLVSLLLGTWGLGAVVLTRFGATPYVPTAARLAAPPEPPQAGLGAPPESAPEDVPTEPLEGDEGADGPAEDGD